MSYYEGGSVAAQVAGRRRSGIGGVLGTVLVVVMIPAQLLLVVGVFVLVVFAGAGQVHRWEYTVASPSDQTFIQEMDALGNQGWEAVSARRAIGEGGDSSYEVILKRRR